MIWLYVLGGIILVGVAIFLLKRTCRRVDFDDIMDSMFPDEED